MATNVRTESLNFPFALGKLCPGAAFASASIPLTINYQPTKADCQKGVEVVDNQFNGIWIQAFPNNAGLIYVCNSSDAPDLVLYSNVIGIMQPGDWWPRIKEWANNRDLSKLYIGAANATDFAIALIDQF